MPWACLFLCAGIEPGHTAPAHPYADLRAFLQEVDVLNHQLESIRREPGKHVADTVSLQHNPLPIYKSAVVVAELFGQLTRVWEQDFPLVGGMQLKFARVELEPGVFLPRRDNKGFL